MPPCQQHGHHASVLGLRKGKPPALTYRAEHSTSPRITRHPWGSWHEANERIKNLAQPFHGKGNGNVKFII